MPMSMKSFLFSVLLFSIFSNVTHAQKPVAKSGKSDLVEVMVDAANSRFFYFSSATRPFGMVNLSPDMNLKGVWNTGYKYNEDTIRCFSHIHCWELSGKFSALATKALSCAI